jgi:hypothetical protein
MHLDNVSPLRLQMTIQHMVDLDIQKVIPLMGVRASVSAAAECCPYLQGFPTVKGQ